jgi:hypothetical protein
MVVVLLAAQAFSRPRQGLAHLPLFFPELCASFMFRATTADDIEVGNDWGRRLPEALRNPP